MVNLIGKVFGRLTVLDNAEKGKFKEKRWLCKCECGNEKIVPTSALQSGNTTSCGCKAIESATKHGMFGTRVYGIWTGMVYRCTVKPFKKNKDYGNRGISVCDEWRKFENFYADMGDPPEGFSIDRIDCNGNYCKENCRWISMFDQQSNKRNNTFIEYKGEIHTIAQWGRIYNIDPKLLRSRIFRSKWDIEKAFTTPVLRSA